MCQHVDAYCCVVVYVGHTLLVGECSVLSGIKIEKWQVAYAGTDLAGEFVGCFIFADFVILFIGMAAPQTASISVESGGSPATHLRVRFKLLRRVTMELHSIGLSTIGIVAALVFVVFGARRVRSALVSVKRSVTQDKPSSDR